MKKRNVLLVVLFFTLLTVNVAAQTGFQGSQNPLGSIFQEINNQITWYDGEGIGSFLVWIVLPALGMYAIFRFIYAKAFGFAEENFRENAGYGNQGLSDMGDSMSKLLAISTSLVSLIFWGGALGWTMLVAGAAGIAWFIWANASGLVGTTAPIPFGGGDILGGNNGDNDLEEENEHLRNLLDEAMDELENLRVQEDQDEEHLGDDEGPEEAEDHITTELNEIETLERQFEQFEQEINDIEQKIQQKESLTQQEEQEAEKLTQKIEQNQQKLQQALNEVDRDINQLSSIEGEILKDLKAENLRETARKVGNKEVANIDQLDSFLHRTDEMLEEIRKLSKNEFEELNQALQEERDIVENLNMQDIALAELDRNMKEFIKELEVFESLEEEEEDIINKAESLAQKMKDKPGFQHLREDEGELEKTEKKFENILEREKQLRNRLQELMKSEKQEKAEKEDILNKLETLESQLKDTRNFLKKLDNEAKEIYRNLPSFNFDENEEVDLEQLGENMSKSEDVEMTNHLREKLSKWIMEISGENPDFPNNNPNGEPVISIVERMSGEINQFISSVKNS